MSGAEVISPELVLVCPELRERALAELPERDPYAFLADRPARARMHEEWQDFFAAHDDEGVDIVEGARRQPARVLFRKACVYSLATVAQVLLWGCGVVAFVALTVGIIAVAD